ncbi:MAG: Bacterial extracellular solute-binding protein [Verrucomicrobia bacterium ADurb.Bin345]|nr:MAG: Bacterial extracellular solute-binding protein [Verrucomicrobia bacterium ADurb.Bin345]
MKALFHFIKSYFALLMVGLVFAWASGSILVYRNRTAPPGATVLRIGHWQLEASVRDAINEMARRYREIHPNVYVVQDAIPEGVYGQWVSTQLLGGTAPDIVQVGAMLPWNIWLSYYNRYFIPISREVNRANPYNRGTELEHTPFRQTYKDGMRTAYVDEMQEYVSIPLSQFGIRIFYNKDLLKRLTGLDAAPEDYREFLRACERIASQKDERGNHYIPIAGSQYHFGMWDSMMFDPLTYGAVRKADFNRDGFVGNDELYTAIKTGRLGMKFPPFEAKFRMLREVTDHFQPGYTGLTRDEAVFLFAQQKAVFMTTGTWDARSLQKQAEGRFEVGVMDFPVPAADDDYYGPIIEGRNYERPGGGFAFGITRTSRNPELALDFLLFMASQAQNEELNRIIGWIPCILGTEMDPMLEAFEPHLEGIYSAMNLWLGGETATKWMQLYSAYQVDQVSYDGLVEQFEPFYKEQGYKDFMEQQRDWRRGMHQNERFLAGIRARALASEGEEAESAWVKYRALTTSRQIWAELTHNRQVQLIEKGPDLEAVGPYEYSPAVLKKIRERIKKEK